MKACGFNFDTTYTRLPQQFFTKLSPIRVPSPQRVIVNHQLAQSIGLDFSNLDQKAQAQLFSGNKLPEGSTHFAQAYAGHQFGHFTMLGDGRALIWGEHITPSQARLDIQFKGSGQTPYSRGGDGKAAVGPMLREYIISEALHYLGIATTRSLAVVTTGEQVLRDTSLPGAILTRVASSHIRIGTFEFAATLEDKQILIAILEHTIQRHYPNLKESENKALDLIQTVMQKQVELIVGWMRIGFIHGVMNTDNMLLCGETIDYGPCAFMDAYHPDTVFSSIDRNRRYAYANQPVIAQWNLARLAETLLPLIHEDTNKAAEMAETLINQFPDLYQHKWLMMMRNKLGLFDELPGDEALIVDLLEWMQSNNADYTNTFRELSQQEKPKGQLYQQRSFEMWHVRWQNRLRQNSKPWEKSKHLMNNTNPAVIPRNHKVEAVLETANHGNFIPLHELLTILQTPYEEVGKPQEYQAPPEPTERIYQTFCGT